MSFVFLIGYPDAWRHLICIYCLLSGDGKVHC